MWDWELIKSGSSQGRYEVLVQYTHEDFHYAHAISYDTEQNEYCLHNHALYELVYCVRGDVVYQAEGVRYQMEPHSLLLLAPAVLHKLFIRSEQPFERHTLYINYFDANSELSSLMGKCLQLFNQQSVGSAYYGPAECAGIVPLLERLERASASDDERISSLAPYFAKALVAELLMIVNSAAPLAFSTSGNHTIDALLLYPSQNFTRDISLSDIAEHFFWSKDHCNRAFHKATGMSVMQYVAYNRVLYARQLLAQGMGAAEAAREVGFSDYSSFYRSYRKVTGRSPRADYQAMEQSEQ